MCGTEQSKPENGLEKSTYSFNENARGPKVLREVEVDPVFEQWQHKEKFDKAVLELIKQDGGIFGASSNSTNANPPKIKKNTPKGENDDDVLEIIQENNNLNNKAGDYAPGVYTAVISRINVKTSQNNTISRNIVTETINLEFDPFLQNEDVLKNSRSLVRPKAKSGRRKFESDSERSTSYHSESLFVASTTFATHSNIFEGAVDEEYRDDKQDSKVFEDEEFPANLESLVGHGVNQKTKEPFNSKA